MKKLFDSSQVREADNYALNSLNIPGIVLMENAALSILNVIEEYFNEAEDAWINSIVILCGKGNNGGDGYALARHLVNKGYPVEIVAFANAASLKGDALINFNIIEKYSQTGSNPELTFYTSLADIEAIRHSSVIIDALLGTGAKGDLRSPYKEVVELVNEFNGLKIAIDSPSGLDVDSGSGEIVFNADITITLAALKKGLFIEKGYASSGEVFEGSIGMDNEYFESLETDSFLLEAEDAYVNLPVRGTSIHKYGAGKVFVLAGSGELPGASFFTTEAAFASGAGAVVLGFPRTIKEIALSRLSGPTLHPYNDNSKEYFSVSNLVEVEERIKWSDVTILGPGMGRHPETVEGVRKILEQFPDRRMVIDADAICAINENWQQFDLSNKILTPHHKEFADLVGKDLTDIKSDILRHGKDFAQKSGAVLVLKGAPTVIFYPSGDIYVNSTGNSGLAKFGTGDVLAGIIGGFAAQDKESFESVLSAVYLHSLAGDILTEEKSIYSVSPDLLIEYLPVAINNVKNEFI